MRYLYYTAGNLQEHKTSRGTCTTQRGVSALHNRRYLYYTVGGTCATQREAPALYSGVCLHYIAGGTCTTQQDVLYLQEYMTSRGTFTKQWGVPALHRGRYRICRSIRLAEVPALHSGMYRSIRLAAPNLLFLGVQLVFWMC